MSVAQRIVHSQAPAATILIRVMVGVVFLLIVGSGPWAVDQRLARRPRR